ncbi:MAG: hypothetical protein ACE5OS_13665 [Anaerolineae bacterium]
MANDLALRMALAIKNEDYVPGGERQRDLAAALAAKVLQARARGSSKAAKVMARIFQQEFDVPDSLVYSGDGQ